MPVITAAEMVYANVLAGRSPARRAGYQTVRVTRSLLSPDDVAFIESWMAPAPDSETGGIRHLFFRLPGGRVALARVAPDDALDAWGRSGLFFGQVLAIDAGEFVAIGANVRTLSNVAPFATSREEAMAPGDADSGELPPRSFHVPEVGDDLSPVSGWPVEVVDAGVAAGLSHLESPGSAPLFVHGGPDEVLAFAGAVLAAFPMNVRASLAFDTAAPAPTARRVWIAGSSGGGVPGGAVSVSLRDRSVHPRIVGRGLPAFARWASQRLVRGEGDHLSRWREGAIAVHRVLRKGPGAEEPMSTLPREMLLALLDGDRELLARRVSDVLRAWAPEAMVDELCRALAAEMPPDEVYAGLLRGFDRARLLRSVLQKELDPARPDPDRRRITLLEELATRAGDVGLMFGVHWWRRRFTALRQALDSCTPADCLELVELLASRRCCPLWKLVTPETAGILRPWLARRSGLPARSRARMQRRIDAFHGAGRGDGSRVLPALERWVRRLLRLW